MKRKYSADFETTTNPNDCRVWAWSICNCDDVKDIYFGNNIVTFIQECGNLANCDIYFHNLRFDSQFIIWYLLKSGWKLVENNKQKELTFSCLINGDNQIYVLELCFRKWWCGKRAYYKKVRIYDSLKKLPFTVKKIAKDFELPIQKLNIDYLAPRDKNHVFTKEEKDYLRNDVEIMARALNIQFKQGLTKMTIGADALGSFKDMIGGKFGFTSLFPTLDFETDEQLRKAYHGGWTYVNPKYQMKDIGKGKVYDVNSLYPWAMRFNQYPIGEPEFYPGKYNKNGYRPLYIQMFKCEFKLKKKHLPCVQIKHSMIYSNTEYLVESQGQTTLTMCNIDIDLFFDQYDVWNIEYICCWSFRAKEGIFNKYIDYWSSVKEKSKGATRQIAKLMLNNLYGKFSTSPNVIEKSPILENDIVKYVVTDRFSKEAIYIPVGIFCTAYARNKTIRTAQKIYDRFVYADTDSLHIIGDEEPIELKGEVHNSKLGKWKNESNFERARFIKAKSYIEEEEINKEMFVKSNSNLDYKINNKYYHLNVKCAGMNDSVKEKVTWDNFKVGFSETGKLTPKNVKGGVILKPTEFTIKEFEVNKIVE